MTTTYTLSETTTFTVTHARHIAAKVATDLKRMQRFYGDPSDSMIVKFEEELVQLLRAGYLATVTYGFRRDDDWIEPTLRYVARDLGAAGADDNDPGRVASDADTTGASFYSYLTYSLTWVQLSEADKVSFQERLPIRRTGAPEPRVSGYLYSERTYSAGGRALDRASVRAF